MDLMPSAIQSYQKNQTLAGWAAQTEASHDTTAVDGNQHSTEEGSAVYLSDKHKIYNWLASEFPLSSNSPANVGRASQKLYEYQIFSLQDVNRVNELLQTQEETPLLKSIEQALAQTQSYTQRETLTHLKQVFTTLEAAELRPVA